MNNCIYYTQLLHYLNISKQLESASDFTNPMRAKLECSFFFYSSCTVWNCSQALTQAKRAKRTTKYICFNIFMKMYNYNCKLNRKQQTNKRNVIFFQSFWYSFIEFPLYNILQVFQATLLLLLSYSLYTNVFSCIKAKTSKYKP